MRDDMKLFDGMYFPAHEMHMTEWMQRRNERVNGRLTYQYHKLVEALRWVRGFRVAVDVGAHVGMWSMHLAPRFKGVIAFEPVELHRACFELNLAGHDNVGLRACALGDHDDSVVIHTSAGSSGDSWVDPSAKGDVAHSAPMHRLDGMLPVDTQALVDFIKLDCEGYELFALRGAEATLRASHPCVIVEQKPGRAQKYGLGERDAVTYLESLGAKLRKEMGGDFIMSWDDE